jgi:hypothetical protein
MPEGPVPRFRNVERGGFKLAQTYDRRFSDAFHEDRDELTKGSSPRQQ